MLYIPKISITTHLTRHLAVTTHQAHHGHSQSVLRYSVAERKVIREEADRIITLDAHDRIPIDQSQRQQVGNTVFSPLSQRLVPSFGVFGKGKKGCVGKLGIEVCYPFVDGCYCASAF